MIQLSKINPFVYQNPSGVYVVLYRLNFTTPFFNLYEVKGVLMIPSATIINALRARRLS